MDSPMTSYCCWLGCDIQVLSSTWQSVKEEKLSMKWTFIYAHSPSRIHNVNSNAPSAAAQTYYSWRTIFTKSATLLAVPLTRNCGYCCLLKLHMLHWNTHSQVSDRIEQFNSQSKALWRGTPKSLSDYIKELRYSILTGRYNPPLAP